MLVVTLAKERNTIAVADGEPDGEVRHLGEDTPPEPTITRGPQGIDFFAGSADDPFFFDIPGFVRFVGSVRAGTSGPGAA